MLTSVARRAAISLASIVVPVALAAAGCGASNAASKPSTPPPEDPAAYYPLEPGWRWAYEIKRDGDTMLATYGVLSRQGDTVTVQAGDDRLTYVLRADGLLRKEPLSAEEFVIKGPVRAGQTWPVEGGHARVTAVGASVEVPAGVFANCAVVEVQRTQPSRVARTTYAPGVGPVIIEVEAEPTAGLENLRAVLRGFTRPGDDPLK